MHDEYGKERTAIRAMRESAETEIWDSDWFVTADVAGEENVEAVLEGMQEKDEK
jgi:hypothetical protein